MGTDQLTISLSEFKNQYSYQVFTHMLGFNPPIGKTFNSPLRKEKHPSFNIFKDERSGEYLFKDFAGDTGDCIRFIELKLNVDFKTALERIGNDFNINISDNPVNPSPQKKSAAAQFVPATAATPPTAKPYELIERAQFNSIESTYFLQYKISIESLKKYNVVPLDGYSFVSSSGKITTIHKSTNELLFCYKHDTWAKIYKPLEKDRRYKFTHLGTKLPGFIFGYDQLPATADLLIITGGEKDVLTLVNLGFNAISLNSETSSLDNSSASDLISRFNKIIVLYDIDETGIKSALKLSLQYSFHIASLPLSLLSEKGKDISDFINLGHTKEELLSILKKAEKPKPTTAKKNMLLVQSANEWINESKLTPIPEMLFDAFWFEGEICILFADTNLGKSILAVQIADSISTGNHIPGFKLEAVKQKVLYLDFELSGKQFEARYSYNFTEHHTFNDNFLRAEIDPESELPPEFPDFEAFLNHSLEQQIIETGISVLIIDNITYLRSETEKAREALPLMKHLKTLKKKYKLSILVLAHTPKRDLTKPISRNDLQGSKMLINFCDSSFAIGESYQDKSLRYLKQIKARNTDIRYDKDNICTCNINKDYNFLKFEFLEFDLENLHLRTPSEKETKDLDTSIIDLKSSNPSLTNREIARQLNTNHVRVMRVLRKSENQ